MTRMPERHLKALARCAEVVRRVEVGESKSSIARELGVSRQRVQQLNSWGRLQRDMAISAANITPSTGGSDE